jgi:hypothetical protein
VLHKKLHIDKGVYMKTRNCFGLIIVLLCAGLAHTAGAQSPANAEAMPLYLPSEDGAEAFSPKLRGRSDFSNVGRELVAELEQAGIVNRSLRGPYRVALPLVTFGHSGPKLMVTYARKLPGSGDNGVLLFIHIPTN